MGDEYAIRATDRSVDAWSTRRLQFEPKGWQVDFRNQLRQALGALDAGQGFLEAAYTSPVRDRSDVENILFYNVGSGFRTTTRRGVRFERSFDDPPPPPKPLAGVAAHHHHYELAAPGEPFLHWREEQVLAEFRRVPLPRLTPETKAGEIWLALAGAAADVNPPPVVPDAISVRVTLNLPAQVSSAAALIKPLLDELISSLHAHDGSHLAEISQRLAGQLSLPPDRVGEVLTDAQQAALGTRRLVHLFGTGVQWNPADELCVACEVILERNRSVGVLLDATVSKVNG